MDLSGISELQEIVTSVLGNAASTDFLKTCSIFALASFIHARKVTKEIKTQFGLLVSVVQQDLDSQGKLLAALTNRVAKIEDHLQHKGD